MTSRVEHTDVGAYALGLLDDDDGAAFEAHLLGCRACRHELTELEGVAGLLRTVGPGPLPRGRPNGGDVIDLPRREDAGRRTRRGTLAMGMAAAVTLVAGGLAIGTQIGAQLGTQADPRAGAQIGAQVGAQVDTRVGAGEPRPTAHGAGGGMGDHTGPAEQFYAAGRPITGEGSDGVTGGLVVESKKWGTHAALKLAGVTGPLECELVSVSTAGERRVMTGWSVPPAGYGVPGSPDPLYMHGGTATPLKDIDHFEVTTTDGRRLLTVRT
ncbi:anti-sigma factor family protein [Nonomuraea maritima]|uniref:anti-sigma factor family protein n=1 Tax=Nonomuraea maritima TaxID=683260 RepID=UPI0037181511